MNYLAKHMNSKVIAHYLWLDGNQNMRYKTKVQIGTDFGIWNADGSSTFQAGIESSEIVIKPVKSVKVNPKYFNATQNYDNRDVYIVLCDVYDIHDKPLESNKRYKPTKKELIRTTNITLLILNIKNHVLLYMIKFKVERWNHKTIIIVI